MTLQEKIQKESEKYGELAPMFLEGANFALDNQWISVDEDLPYNHEELIITEYNKKYTQLVLVRTNRGIVLDYMRHFIDKNKDYWIWGRSNSGNYIYKVYHWLNIPILKDIIEIQGKILKFLNDPYNPNHHFIQLQ